MPLSLRRRRGNLHAARHEGYDPWYAIMCPTAWTYVINQAYITNTPWGFACYDGDVDPADVYLGMDVTWNGYMYQSDESRGPGFEQSVWISETKYLATLEFHTREHPSVSPLLYGPYSRWSWPWTVDKPNVPGRPWGWV